MLSKNKDVAINAAVSYILISYTKKISRYGPTPNISVLLYGQFANCVLCWFKSNLPFRDLLPHSI